MALVLALPVSSAFSQQKTGEATPYAPATANTENQQLTHELIVDARLTDEGDVLEKGLVWRVYSTKADSNGKLILVDSQNGGTTSFQLPIGTYYVHTAFGRAGATKRISVPRGGTNETFILDAGGLKLNAVAGGKQIAGSALRFSVYSLEKDQNNKLIVGDVPADQIIRLNAGTYHVVSSYGKINATVRADLRVSAGKLTEATMQHRAARITFKLVSQAGGGAIAGTAWSIVSEQGALIKESSSTFPNMVLSSGNYTALARNGGEVYTADFKVEDGKDSRIEVVAIVK